MRDALTAELVDLASNEDPVAIVKGINDFYAELEHELEQFSVARLDAFAELREQGMTYGQIADQIGVSRGRVAQFARMSGTTGRRPQNG